MFWKSRSHDSPKLLTHSFYTCIITHMLNIWCWVPAEARALKNPDERDVITALGRQKMSLKYRTGREYRMVLEFEV